MADNFNSLQEFNPGVGTTASYHALAALENAGIAKVSRLHVSLRVVLE